MSESNIEQQLLAEIKRVMLERGLKQADYARSRDVDRQAVGPYFVGKRRLLTGTCADLLDWLGVEIQLIPTGKGLKR